MRNIQNDPRLKNVIMLRPHRQLTLFLVGLVGLVVASFLIELFMYLIARSIAPTDYDYEMFIDSSLSSMIVNGSAYVILGVVFIILLKNESEEFFKSFKSWKPYVAALVGFGSIILFNLAYSIFIACLGISMTDNGNEASLTNIVNDFPLASLVIFAFIGPACEELTYRVGLFSLTRRVNRVLAYIATIIVFTLIHFDFTSTTMVNELLNIPAYAFGAFVLTYLYERYGFASSLSAHITNNLFSILLTIFGKIK